MHLLVIKTAFLVSGSPGILSKFDAICSEIEIGVERKVENKENIGKTRVHKSYDVVMSINWRVIVRMTQKSS